MPLDLTSMSIGKVGFIERHGLWDDEQKDAAERVRAQVDEHDLQVVRISFGDQHGLLRGKTVLRESFPHALRNGVDFMAAMLVFDTANGLAFNPFVVGSEIGMPELTGGPDGELMMTLRERVPAERRRLARARRFRMRARRRASSSAETFCSSISGRSTEVIAPTSRAPW